MCEPTSLLMTRWVNKRVANGVLEIFPVEALGGEPPFQLFHAGEIVLDAQLIEPLDHIGFDADAHVFAALHEQGLIDQVAQGIFLPVLDGSLQLLGSAARLAVLFGVFSGSGAGLFVVAAGDDFVVHAGDDFFNDAAGIGIDLGRGGGGFLHSRLWRGLAERPCPVFRERGRICPARAAWAWDVSAELS